MDDYFETTTSTVMKTADEHRGDYVFQQAVTLTAHLVYNDNQKDSLVWVQIFGWRLPSNYLPLLCALTLGIMIILILLSSLIVWRYCWLPRRKNDFSGQLLTPENSQRMHVLRNGPWAYVSVQKNTSPSKTKSAGTEIATPTTKLTGKSKPMDSSQESPTYVRQISPSNSIIIHLNENNNLS